MMMTATAGAGYERRQLFDNPKKPIPRWVWGAVGASLLVHAGLAVWLYNQRYEMPVQETVIDDAPIIIMERPPVIEEPVVETPEPPAPPIPIHNPTVIHPTDVTPTPFEVPDEPVVAPVGDGPISMDPVVPDVAGTNVDPTPPAPPSVITNPRWISMPSARQMERAYPTRAIADGVGGRATLTCTVTATGSVANCSVASESPANYGFGQAAMSLSRHFRISPRTVDGRPVEGARVSIPLSFNLG